MESSRFPGKPLIDIEGLPMVVHVLKRSELCKNLSQVYVATDSQEIASAVRQYGGKVIMTSKDCKTGSDRIAEAAQKIDCDIVVNVQGDEPLVKPFDIAKLTEVICADRRMKFATLVCKTPKSNDITECKVVMDKDDNIIYMSRSDIPSSARKQVDHLFKLYCVVAFRKNFLKKFVSWEQSPLEKIEFIEYLRIVENGYKMRGVKIDAYTTSVDTPADLAAIREMMKQDTVKFEYLL